MAPRVATRITSRSNRLTAAYLAIGGLFVLGYFAAGLTTQVQDVIYQLPGMAAPIAVLIGVIRYRPTDVRPWLILAAGPGADHHGRLDVAGGRASSASSRFPRRPTASTCPGRSLVSVAVMLLVRGRIPGGDRAGIIDALIVAIGAALLSWTFLMRPLVADPFASIAEIVTALAYPVVDIVLLAVLVRLVLVPARRAVALNLILLALVSLLLSDVAVCRSSPWPAATRPATSSSSGWLVASVLWGAAALHPSMAHVADPVEVGEAPAPAWRLALLAAASLMAPAVMVIQALTGRTDRRRRSWRPDRSCCSCSSSLASAASCATCAAPFTSARRSRQSSSGAPP